MEAEVLLGGQLVVEGLLLEDEADVPAHRRASLDDVEAGDPGRPRGRPGQGAQHLDGGRLPRAIGPEEGEDLTLGHVEADTLDRGQVTVGLGQAPDLNSRRRGVRSTTEGRAIDGDRHPGPVPKTCFRTAVGSPTGAHQLIVAVVMTQPVEAMVLIGPGWGAGDFEDRTGRKDPQRCCIPGAVTNRDDSSAGFVSGDDQHGA